MERRFELRKEAMLAECEVAPDVFRGVVERLSKFLKPFAELLVQPAQRQPTTDYLAGLVSDLERKNVESIAYRHDQDRRNLQHFIGGAEWDHRPLLMELARQVGEELGEDDGVIVFDPSAFPKQGQQSVGVARQWCGRLGKVDNCQVAVYMGYVSRAGHSLVNTRLYLSKEWASDRARRKAAGVPKEIRFQTRHEQALEMLKEQGHLLPHAWIAGDDEMGRNAFFRRDLHRRGEQYLLAVPCDMLIRDLQREPPPYQGRGAVPKVPFERVDRWRDALADNAWTRIPVRDGEKGPLEVELATCRVQAKIGQRVMKYEETLVIVRCLDEEGATKYDFYFSNAPRDTLVKEFARVALAAHRIEESIKRSKSEAGLSHYEVRNWRGWHHHQVLSLMATWFLVGEHHRGKKMDAGDYGPAGSRRPGDGPPRRVPLRHSGQNCSQQNASIAPKRRSSLRSLQIT
ncbi:MAG: IS701 family transposase [Chthoniobacterales bacterium]